MEEIKLMKGNEAMAEAAIRAGADAYFGYPITPQSEHNWVLILDALTQLDYIKSIFGRKLNKQQRKQDS